MKNKNRKPLKIAALVAALILLVGLGWFANGLLGNPVSKALARKGAESWLETHYADTDYQIDKVSFDFKSGGYYARISSPSSIDTHFTLSMDALGHVRYDSYESDVENNWNTWYRLETAYRELCDTLLKDPAFPYSPLHIGFGSLLLEDSLPEDFPASMKPDALLHMEDLVPDGEYDIRELGRKYGQLVLYVEDEEVTEARAAEILLDIRSRMDEAGIPFRCVDFSLMYPRPEDPEAPRREGEIDLLCILYEGIAPEGMEQRVHEVHEATLTYYAAEDAKMAAEIPEAR